MLSFDGELSNGKIAWKLKASGIAIVIFGIVVLALFADNGNQAMAWIGGLLRASAR